MLVSGARYRIHVKSKVSTSVEKQLEGVMTVGNKLIFLYEPPICGEYAVILTRNDQPVETFHFFALSEEMARYRPYVGDLHSHTTYSDGKCSPGFRIIQARLLGLDFIAITDHRRFPPCLEAAEFAKANGLDILVVRGEESHPDYPGGHIVAIGIQSPVDELKLDALGNQAQTYIAEHAAIVKELEARSDLVPGLKRELYAQTLWHIRKIHAQGGIAVLAHPYWVSAERFDLDREIWHQCLRDGEMDAIELFGDVKPEDNSLAVQRCMDHLADAGRRYPLVGSSDVHSAKLDDNFGRLFTIVFAEEPSESAVIEAVLAGRSVACEELDGQPFRAYGRFEWVEFAHFLRRRFLPEHKRLCMAEGQLWYQRCFAGGMPDSVLDAVATARISLYVALWG